MKRKIMLCFFAVALTGFLFAQEQQAPARQGPQKITVAGKLEWTNGRIAIKNAGKTYYVSGLNRLIGFVDGLKEGAQVSLEGLEFKIPAVPDYSFFRTSKVTFNGKDYAFDNELAAAGFPKGGHKVRAGQNDGGAMFPMHTRGMTGQWQRHNQNRR
jgi:hypothetical protein